MEIKNIFRQVNLFYMLAFLFTGLLYGLSSFICKTLILGFVETVLLTTMSAQLAPSLAAIISKKRYSETIKFFVKPELNWSWLLIIIVPFVSVYAQYLILQSTGQSFINSPFFTTPSILIFTVITTLIGSIGEEIGWRGYLYIILRKHIKPWISSLITGLLWGLWHFTKIFQLGFAHYCLFILSVIPISMLMTYINDQAKGSILPSILFHTFLNLSFMYLLFERETIVGYLISILVLSIILLFIRFIDQEYFKQNTIDNQNYD